MIDSIIGPFNVYTRGTTSPALTLAIPESDSPTEARVKQGVFAEDCRLAVCGGAENCVLLYGLHNSSSPIMPSQVLHYKKNDAIGVVQTVSVS